MATRSEWRQPTCQNLSQHLRWILSELNFKQRDRKITLAGFFFKSATSPRPCATTKKPANSPNTLYSGVCAQCQTAEEKGCAGGSSHVYDNLRYYITRKSVKLQIEGARRCPRKRECLP
ncbi:hypothetical protein EAF04_009915 [Stromatinia cepivora]|nr:hypothetical protein EAF04_009915 [Stromatinia cepivora]